MISIIKITQIKLLRQLVVITRFIQRNSKERKVRESKKGQLDILVTVELNVF